MSFYATDLGEWFAAEHETLSVSPVDIAGLPDLEGPSS
jgi:hypothetical protein